MISNMFSKYQLAIKYAESKLSNMQLEALHWFPSSSPPQFYGSLDLRSVPKLSSKARQIWFHINCSQLLRIKGDSHSYDLWVISFPRLKRNVVFRTPERLICLEIFFFSDGNFFQSLTSFMPVPFSSSQEKKKKDAITFLWLYIWALWGFLY